MSDQTASACKLENQIHIMDCKTTIKETIKDIVLTKVTVYGDLFITQNIIIFYLLFRKYLIHFLYLILVMLWIK